MAMPAAMSTLLLGSRPVDAGRRSVVPLDERFSPATKPVQSALKRRSDAAAGFRP